MQTKRRKVQKSEEKKMLNVLDCMVMEDILPPSPFLRITTVFSEKYICHNGFYANHM